MKELDRQALLSELEQQEHLDTDSLGYFRILLRHENVTRDQGADHHLSAYFAAYDPATQRILMSLHLKTGMWLIPGGHMDDGETPCDTVVREWKEELNSEITIDEVKGPFFISVTPILNREKQPLCSAHYDIWYYVESAATDFAYEASELGGLKWVSFEEARSLTIDGNTRRAITALQEHTKTYG